MQISPRFHILREGREKQKLGRNASEIVTKCRRERRQKHAGKSADLRVYLTLNVFNMLSRIDGYLTSLQKWLTSLSSLSRTSCSSWFSAICSERTQKQNYWKRRHLIICFRWRQRRNFNRNTFFWVISVSSFLTFFWSVAEFSFHLFYFLLFFICSQVATHEQQQRSRFKLL